MLTKIEKLLHELETTVIETKEQVEEYRIKWLSKKGEITLLFEEFKQKCDLSLYSEDLRNEYKDELKNSKYFILSKTKNKEMQIV